MIRVVRLGSPRDRDEGVRIGTVRRPPRGVKKENFASLNYFDVWLPELAPPADVVTWALSKPWTDARWSRYSRRYRAQMAKAPASRIIATLAALSKQTNFSIGCYCEDEERCHRSLLRDILRDAGAELG